MRKKERSISRALRQIPGARLAAAAELLPPCSAEAEARTLEVETEFWGRYRVTFKPARHSGPAGAAPRWVWIPVAAEPLA